MFADGSATYCKVETMYQFTTWGSGRNFWFYQSLNDIAAPNVLTYIKTLQWTAADQ